MESIYLGKDAAQVAVGRREGQVAFQIERSLCYCLYSVHCQSRSDAELGERLVSSPASSVRLPGDFRSSEHWLGQMTGATPKLGESRESSALRFANCL